MTLRRLIILGALAFVLFLLVTLPAQLVFSRLEPMGLKAAGVSGSVWKGQAANLSTGPINLGRLTWDLHVLRLLTGRASASVTLQLDDGQAQGDVSAGLGGTVSLADAIVSWPLSRLSSSGLPGGWNGTVNAKLAEVRLANGVPTLIEGTVDILNLVGPANRPANLGSFRATFPATGAVPADGAQVGTIEDLEGPIAVTGTITLSPDRSYVVDGQIATRPDAPAQIVNSLQYLGEPDGAGRRPFSVAGTF